MHQDLGSEAGFRFKCLLVNNIGPYPTFLLFTVLFPPKIPQRGISRFFIDVLKNNIVRKYLRKINLCLYTVVVDKTAKYSKFALN